MAKDYRARYFEIAQDGIDRTSSEVAELLGMPDASRAIQFLSYFKMDLVIRSSGWRLIKTAENNKKTLWRLEKQ